MRHKPFKTKTPNPQEEASQQLTKEHIEALDVVYSTSYCSREHILEKADEALSIMKEAVEGNGETLNRDNPVPSLEELAERFCKDRYHHDVRDGIFQFIKFVNKQNGVETNKVQPKSAAQIMREWGKERVMCDCYYTKFCKSTMLKKGITCKDDESYTA